MLSIHKRALSTLKKFGENFRTMRESFLENLYFLFGITGEQSAAFEVTISFAFSLP